MDSLAPHYGDDYWFLSYHAMALSEDGRLAAARPMIERSVALNPNNAHGAHGFAHVCYESGEPETARAYLSPWLADLSARRIFLRSFELASVALRNSARRLGGGACSCIGTLSHSTATAADRNRKCRMGRRFYGARNSPVIRAIPPPGARCTSMRKARCRQPGSGLADLHVILAHAVMGDDAALDARTRQMEELAQAGRYPSGSYLPQLARGFAAFERGDFVPARSRRLRRLPAENERIGGSRAQHDLIEFTLLKAYLNADRPEDARRLLRRAQARELPGCPSAGVAAVQ